MRALMLILCSLQLGCIAGSNPALDPDLLDAEVAATDAGTADAEPDIRFAVAVETPTVEPPDAAHAPPPPTRSRQACATAPSRFFDPAPAAPALDGCEAQCIRLAHCASHTWDDGSDQCRCLEDDDEPAILDACKATCHTTQGELLYYALFDTPVCSEIVPAVTSRFATFDAACGGRP